MEESKGKVNGQYSILAYVCDRVDHGKRDVELKHKNTPDIVWMQRPHIELSSQHVCSLEDYSTCQRLELCDSAVWSTKG